MQTLSIKFAAAALTLLFATSLSSAQDAAQSVDTKQLESQALVKRFAGELQTALMTAMSDGGPQRAITVCKDIAPEIASQLSRESGAAVSRTSLRLRNPQNLPREWQEQVLQEFDAAAASGADAATLEYFASAESNNGARYMKAIPTGGLCLACHGSELAPDVSELLDANYPHDRATGYASGEVRGAFSVIWPRAADANPANE